MTSCRYDKIHGYLQPTHWPSCSTPECSGCLPCDESHCTAREGCIGHLDDAHPLTCSRCVNRTRHHIRRIEALAELMLPLAMEDGENDPERSEAAYLAGPAADPRKVAQRRVHLMRAIDRLPESVQLKALEALPDEDPWHPYAVLGRWDMMLREDYDQPTTLKVTISRSADYLVGLLERLAQDDNQDFAGFAREIRDCSRHLEATLDNVTRVEKGAPCPDCEKPAPRLVKVYGYRVAYDRWQCSRVNTHWWSDDDYRKRIDEKFIVNAEWLPMSDLVRRIEGVSKVAVRKWAERSEVRKRHDSGRVVYSVEDVASRHAAMLERKA